MKIQKASLLLFVLAVLSSGSSAGKMVDQEEINKNTSDSVTLITTQTVQQDILLKTENDITVEINPAKVINTGAEIGICYTTLDG